MYDYRLDCREVSEIFKKTKYRFNGTNLFINYSFFISYGEQEAQQLQSTEKPIRLLVINMGAYENITFSPFHKDSYF